MQESVFIPRSGRVYISGPMTGEHQYNYPVFWEASATFKAHGIDVLDPADQGPLEDYASWQNFMRRAINLLTQATHIYLLAGWQDSAGAKLERLVADSLGIPRTELPCVDANCSKCRLYFAQYGAAHIDTATCRKCWLTYKAADSARAQAEAARCCGAKVNAGYECLECGHEISEAEVRTKCFNCYVTKAALETGSCMLCSSKATLAEFNPQKTSFKCFSCWEDSCHE